MSISGPLGERSRLFGDIVRALSVALDHDEATNVHHTWRVGVLAHRIAEQLGLADAGLVFYAGLLHDIGAVGLPEHTVHYAARGFSDPESRDHPTLGARIIRPLSLLRPLERFLVEHHERYDGGGFPSGISGADIALESSVLFMADVLDIKLREARPADRPTRAKVIATAQRGTSCPVEVADATVQLLGDQPQLVEQLFDPTALEILVRATRATPPGLEQTTRLQILGQLLWVFARVVDAKHSYTYGHSARVAYYAYQIAQALDDPRVDGFDVICAGLLHDVGKVGVPRRLLDKPGKLTDAEWQQVRRHGELTETIIAAIGDLAYLAYPAAAHHEKYGGGGYPRGRRGEAIPLIGRILAYADVYDALTSERAYRPAKSHREAVAIIRGIVGEHLDPHLADVALQTLSRVGRRVSQLSLGILGFQELFMTDEPDLGRVMAGADSVPASQRRGTVSWRGDRLVTRKQRHWVTIELDDALAVSGEIGPLGRLLGEPELAAGADLGALLQPGDGALLRSQLGRLGPGAAGGLCLTAQSGTPIELLATRPGDDWLVHLREADEHPGSLQRMALWQRNFLVSSEAVVLTDRDGVIVDVNRAFADLFGHLPEELVARNVRMFQSEHQSPELYLEIGKSIGDPEIGAWAGAVVAQRKDGSTVSLQLGVAAVRDATGSSIGFIGRCVDMTERDQMERELERTNADLRRLSQLKSDLMAVTSHDLKSPLSAIVSLASLLRDQGDQLSPERRERHLTQIISSGQALTAFINDLLDAERIEAGTLALELRRIRLDEVVRSSVTSHGLASDKGVEVQLRTEGRAHQAVADAARMEQVFGNLLSNAIKFSPRSGIVEVIYDATAESQLRVEILDRGPGIPPADHEAIFDRYFQVKREGAVSTRGFGSGLGLSIVKHLVELHHGKVWVEDRPGGGCRFIVELPRRQPGYQGGELSALLVARFDPSVNRLVDQLQEAGLSCTVVDSVVEARRLQAYERPELVVVLGAILTDDQVRFVDELRRAGGRPRLLAGVFHEAPEEEAELFDRLLSLPLLDIEIRELARAVRFHPNQEPPTPWHATAS